MPADDASVLSEARKRERVRVTTMLSALSIKPLEGSRWGLRRDAVYGNSIDLELKAIVKA